MKADKTNRTAESSQRLLEMSARYKDSGTADLKRQVLKLNQELAKCLNGVHVFLERKLRNGELILGDSTINASSHKQVVRQIPRVHHENLSTLAFLQNFAIPKKPVIITGLNFTSREGNIDNQQWSLDFFKRTCGRKWVSLKTQDYSGTSWGRLQDAETLRLSDFIDTFSINATRQTYYLHDWSLPRSCPEVFGEPPFDTFQVPKYFAQDYFQRNPFEGYAQSWPSLFIGAKGTESSMHIDSGGTNFWLYLLSGQKEWIFYDFEDVVNLYQVNAHFNVDAFDPDTDKFPLERLAKRWHVVQEPGELVYIPARCPHAVRNFKDIHAISMNYVDDSNYLDYLWEQLIDESYRAFEVFTDDYFPIGTHVVPIDDVEDPYITWGQWKSKAWKSPEVVERLQFVDN